MISKMGIHVLSQHTTQRDLEITAIHEAGHTLMHLLHGDKVLKTSIMAYSSGVGGVTIRDMDDTGDYKLMMQSDMEKQIRVLLAGKCAEDIVYGEHTQGCSNDIQKASDIVYEMVKSFAYSKDMMMNISDDKQLIKDKEIISRCNSILEEKEQQTKEMLLDNEDKLLSLRDRLLKENTLVNPALE